MSVKEWGWQFRTREGVPYPSNINLITATQRGYMTLHEVEIAQPLQFVVIRNARRATTKTDLGSDIQVEFRATIYRLALERLTLPPLIH